MNLVYSLATRGRQNLLKETLPRTLANASLPNTRIIIQADADDVPQPEFADKRVSINIAPREDTVAQKWNRAMTVPADLYVPGTDDDPIITPAWDAKFLDAARVFPDGIGAVYGHLQNASFPAPYGFTAKWVEKLGYIFPEHFPYWFCDHWTDDIARITGRISFADVTTDLKAGPTQEMREPAWWATWFDAAVLVRRKEAHSLINDPEFASPDWLKQMLLSHHPLIEWRSRWINDSVRAQFKAWTGPSKDERYNRVRMKAASMVPYILDGMEAMKAKAYLEYLLPPTSVPVLGLPKVA